MEVVLSNYGVGVVEILGDFRAVTLLGRHSRGNIPLVCASCVFSHGTCFSLPIVMKTFFDLVKHHGSRLREKRC